MFHAELVSKVYGSHCIIFCRYVFNFDVGKKIAVFVAFFAEKKKNLLKKLLITDCKNSEPQT